MDQNQLEEIMRRIEDRLGNFIDGGELSIVLRQVREVLEDFTDAEPVAA